MKLQKSRSPRRDAIPEKPGKIKKMKVRKKQMCKEIERTSKKDQKIAREHIAAYNLTPYGADLYSIYKQPSYYKQKAYEYCRNLCNDLNGFGLKVINGNCQTFTVGFIFPDSETGKINFAYITKDYDRFCHADDLIA